MWFRNSEDDWENALLLFGAWWVVQRLGSGGSFNTHELAKRAGLEPTLPDGVRLPGSGELREVPRVHTPLDAHGFPALFNTATQIVEQWTHPIEELLRDWVNLSPAEPPPDPEYDGAGRMFAAQSSLENDNGRAVYGFNLGNITVTRGDYFLNPPSDTLHKYGSYNYPLQGAVAQVARIKRLWPDAYKTAFLGPSSDAIVHEYSRQLHAGRLKYSESDPEVYAAGIVARAKQLAA
jgi:hypothetical protein